jgi:hypothetical protein
VTEKAEDPRARFRHLPEPVRPDELVETSDTAEPEQVEQRVTSAWKTVYLGGAGLP